jgi:hypothetical protein
MACWGTLATFFALINVRGAESFVGGIFVSIIRVGLSETKNFADGYDAIFGKKSAGQEKKAETKAEGGKARKKKPARKKK